MPKLTVKARGDAREVFILCMKYMRKMFPTIVGRDIAPIAKALDNVSSKEINEMWKCKMLKISQWYLESDLCTRVIVVDRCKGDGFRDVSAAAGIDGWDAVIYCLLGRVLDDDGIDIHAVCPFVEDGGIVIELASSDEVGDLDVDSLADNVKALRDAFDGGVFKLKAALE